MTTKLKTTQILHGASALDTVLAAHVSAAVDYSTTYDFPAVAAGSVFTQAFAVTGAVLGDFAQVSLSQNLSSLILTAYVSAADQVTIVAYNPTAGTINLASGTLKLRLTRSV